MTYNVAGMWQSKQMLVLPWNEKLFLEEYLRCENEKCAEYAYSYLDKFIECNKKLHTICTGKIGCFEVQ